MIQLKFIIQRGSLCGNEGDVAMALSTIELIRKSYPNEKVYFISGSGSFDKDSLRLKSFGYDIELVPDETSGEKFEVLLYFILTKIFKINPKIYKKKKKLPQLYFESDLVVDIGGDMLNDSYGKECSYNNFLKVLFPIVCNAKVCIFPQSIGPFIYFKNKMLAKYILNRCQYVIAREKITYKILKEINIKKLYPEIIHDMAFHLDPPESNMLGQIFTEIGVNINKTKPLFGIGVSRAISRFKNRSIADSIEKNI